MSLIHWWPLNGDTRDLGIKNLNGSLIGSTSFDNAGKIGQCLLADTGGLYSGRGVDIPSNLVSELSGKDYSFCAWVKVNGNHVHYEGAIISSGNWNVSCWAFGLNQDNTAINPAGSWYDTSYVSYTFEVGKWYHVVSVQKSGTNYVYVNGSLVGTVGHSPISQSDASNTCIGRETYAGGYFGFNGCINDVRIYDHALSAKEVKEISKGLVLHYNFEDTYAEGTTNLINQNGAITYTVRCSTYKNGVKIDWTNTDNQGDTYFMFNTPNMTEGVTYTLSFDCEGLLSDSDTTWAVSNTYSPTRLHNGRNAITFTPNSSALQLFFDDWSRDTRLSNLRLTNFQLEQKDHATPYVNGTRPNGLIYDNSGYGYNGTSYGNPEFSKDSGSGEYSLDLIASEKYIKFKSLNFITTGTVIVWAKYLSSNTSDSKMIIGDDSSTAPYLGAANSDNAWYSNSVGSITHYRDGQRNNYLIRDDKWHCYAFTGISFASGWNGNMTICYYGGYSNGYQFHGMIADIKIFNTILSETDILAEYQRKASIDKSGKLFAPYINEYETTNNLIEKTTFNIENGTNFRTWSYLAACTEATYNANWPNDTDISLSAYVQSNCQVTQTSQGIRIYSEANATSDSTWGGLVFSPMVYSRCLIKGHHYRISWHVKGHSSRQMTDVYWTNNVGWGQYPDAEPTVHKTCLPPANFDGEMDCFYDFTIEDDIFKTTTSDVHSGFDPNTSYLAYASFKIGFTYQETGSMGTDIYITNLKLYDLTTGDVYKIEKSGIVKTVELVSGRRDSARLHSDGVIDITDIEEC